MRGPQVARLLESCCLRRIFTCSEHLFRRSLAEGHQEQNHPQPQAGLASRELCVFASCFRSWSCSAPSRLVLPRQGRPSTGGRVFSSREEASARATPASTSPVQFPGLTLTLMVQETLYAHIFIDATLLSKCNLLLSPLAYTGLSLAQFGSSRNHAGRSARAFRLAHQDLALESSWVDASR